jgi:predicted nucleic acid-binding protein
VIVVDTNVIAYLLLPSDRGQEARCALRRDPSWAAPLLWRSELRHVLARQVRRGALPLAAAFGLLQLGQALLEGAEYDVDGEDVLRLAVESGCSAYDCEFVVLARQLGVPLVTADAEIASRYPDTAVSLDVFANESARRLAKLGGTEPALRPIRRRRSVARRSSSNLPSGSTTCSEAEPGSRKSGRAD